MVSGFNSSVDGRRHCILGTSFPTLHSNVEVSEREKPSIRSHKNRHLKNNLPSKSISLTAPSLEKENCYKLPVSGIDKHQMFSLYVGWLHEVHPFAFSFSPLQTDATCITQSCVKPNNDLRCWEFGSIRTWRWTTHTSTSCVSRVFTLLGRLLWLSWQYCCAMTGDAAHSAVLGPVVNGCYVHHIFIVFHRHPIIFPILHRLNPTASLLLTLSN